MEYERDLSKNIYSQDKESAELSVRQGDGARSDGAVLTRPSVLVIEGFIGNDRDQTREGSGQPAGQGRSAKSTHRTRDVAERSDV